MHRQTTLRGLICVTLAVAAGVVGLLAPAAGADAPAGQPRLKKVIVAFKTHFDIGYTDLAAAVVERYRTSMADKALDVCDLARQAPPERRFVWTLSGWPMSQLLWSGQTPERRERIERAVRDGLLVWHALPFSLETESLDLEDLVRGLRFSSALSRRFGMPLARDAKMTDVPSHAWILPTVLRHAGVEFMHVGSNAANPVIDIPMLFWWEGPDGSRVLTLYNSQGYGTVNQPGGSFVVSFARMPTDAVMDRCSGFTPPPGWPCKTWLVLIHTGDNQGPPSPEAVEKILGYLRRKLPGVEIRSGRLSDFADAVLQERPKLPVVRADMPESWIHGIMSMPVETKIARNTRPAIAALESLEELLRRQGVAVRPARDAVAAAYEQCLLYGEHTWGASSMYYSPRVYGKAWEEARAQGKYAFAEDSWREHGSYARTAQQLVTPALAADMQALAGGVKASGPRIVVFNPLPWRRSDVVSLAAPAGQNGGWKDAQTGQPAACAVRGRQFYLLAVDVPAMGYRSYVPAPADDRSGALAADPAAGVIENAFFRLKLDAARGTVESLVDKRSGRQWVDGRSPYGLGQYLYERFSTDVHAAYVQAYCQIHPGWEQGVGKPGMPAAAQSPYVAASPRDFTLHIERGAVSVEAVMAARADGQVPHDVELRVALYPDQPYVDLQWSIRGKKPEPRAEAGWLCLPLAVPRPTFCLGRVGSLTDPARDTVAGCNNQVFCLSSGMTAADAAGTGIGLCPIDAPLVSLGAPGLFQFTRTFTPRPATVLVNLFNNVWGTNYQQWIGGSWSSRVRLWAADQKRAEADLITPGWEARSPCQAAFGDGPAGTLPLSQSGVELSRRGVLVTAFGPNPDGQGTLLRLWEQAGRDGACTVHLPAAADVAFVQPVDLRGEPTGRPLPVKDRAFTVSLRAIAPLSVVFGGSTQPQRSPVPEDLREITLSFPVDNPSVKTFFTYAIRRYDGPQLIPRDAFLEYDVRFPGDSFSFCGGLDLESVPRTSLMLRNMRLKDEHGQGIHPAADLQRFARDKWYRRRFDLSSLAGKPFQQVFLSAQMEESHKKPGRYSVQYRRMRIVDSGGQVYWNLYPPSGTLPMLAPSALYDVTLTAQGLAGVLIQPDSYYVGPGENLALDVLVRNFDPDKRRQITVAVDLKSDHTTIPVCEDMAFDLGPGEARTIVEKISKRPEPGNYRAVAQFRIGHETFSSRSEVISVTNQAVPLPAAGHLFAPGTIAWGADFVRFPNLPAYAHLREMGANFVNLFVSWSQVEIRPGQYDFSMLDKMVAYAARCHLRAELFFINQDTDYPEWYRDQCMVDQTGSVFARRGRDPSFWAPRGHPAFLKLVKAVAERYKTNGVVAAYGSHPGGGVLDGFYYRDRSPGGALHLYDYSRYSQARFREYVRDVLHLSLEQASRRYGLPLASWDDLKQPEPVASLDLRPLWWDFQSYRVWTVARMWDDICHTIREVDPVTPIELCYGGPEEYIGFIGNDYDAGAEAGRKYRASIHNTCYEGESMALLLGTYTRDRGVVHTFEPAGTPPDFPHFQLCLFHMLKYGAKGHCWVSTDTQGIYPTYTQMHAAAEEISDAQPVGKRLGILESLSFDQCKLTRRGDELFEAAQFAATAGYTASLYTDRAFLGEAPRLDPAKMPLLVDYGLPVLTSQAADAVADYVRRGGTAMLFSQSGRFTAGNPQEQCRLLRALGYAGAAGVGPRSGEGVAAGQGILKNHRLRMKHSVSLADLPLNHAILAGFDDGRAAIARWSAGKGQVILFAGFPDLNDPATVQSLRVLFADCGVTPPASASAGVESAVLQKGDVQYVILYNPRGATVNTLVSLPDQTRTVQLADLVNRVNLCVRTAIQWRDGMTLTMSPYEIRVLALDPPDKPRAFPARRAPREENVQRTN